MGHPQCGEGREKEMGGHTVGRQMFGRILTRHLRFGSGLASAAVRGYYHPSPGGTLAAHRFDLTKFKKLKICLRRRGRKRRLLAFSYWFLALCFSFRRDGNARHGSEKARAKTLPLINADKRGSERAGKAIELQLWNARYLSVD